MAVQIKLLITPLWKAEAVEESEGSAGDGPSKGRLNYRAPVQAH